MLLVSYISNHFRGKKVTKILLKLEKFHGLVDLKTKPHGLEIKLCIHKGCCNGFILQSTAYILK